MKKTAFFLLAFILLIPQASAASLFTPSISLDQDRSEFMETVTLQATEENEITPLGIELVLLENRRILWHDEDQTITASGSAVEAGRMTSEPQITYLSDVEGYRDYKIIHIAVDEPFLAGEQVQIDGLALRSYNRDFSHKDLYVNLDEDRTTFEATSENAYRVSDDSNGDRLAPYPPLQLNHEIINENQPAIRLTWKFPPDYDLVKIEGEKQITRNGQTLFKEDIFEGFKTSYLDEEVQIGDQITYTLFSKDQFQFSEFLTINVTVSDPVDMSDDPDFIDNPNVSTDSFFDLLKSLKPQKTCQVTLFDRCFLWKHLFDLSLIY